MYKITKKDNKYNASLPKQIHVCIMFRMIAESHGFSAFYYNINIKIYFL